MNTIQTRIALRQLSRSLRGTSNELTDCELLGRFAAGDDYAFTMLVRRHGPMVLGVCRGVLSNQADAEDAFQAAFLALARQAGRSCQPSCVGGWLHAVARRAAVKLRGSEALRRKHEQIACEMNQPSASQQADLRETLDEEVSRLPETCREAILRCYFDGQTREEAARQLGWSLRTLERRLEQGRELLRERLTARGTTLGVLLALAPAIVPSALADLTVRAALGEAPARVAELAATALPAFSVLRGKIVLTCVLLLGLVAGSALALLPRTTPPVRAASVAPVQKTTAPPSLELPLPEGAMARLGTTRFRHGFVIFGAAFSPDGKVIASCGAGRGLCLWETSTGRLLHHCSGQSSPYVQALAMSPDGRTIADHEGRLVKLWSVETGKELRQFAGHTSRVLSLAFSPKGDVLASGGGADAKIRLWHPQTGRELRVLEGHTGAVRALAFRHDGKVLASCSDDHTVRLWDPLTGKQLFVCEGHLQQVFSLTFEPSGKRLLSCGFAGDIREWDCDTGKQVRLLVKERANSTQRASALALSPDGQALAVGRYGDIALLDLAMGKELRRWTAQRSRAVLCLAWSPDGRTLLSGAVVDSTVRRWDPQTGKERTLPTDGHSGPVNHLVFPKEGGRLFSTGDDGRLLEWDLRTRSGRSLCSTFPVPSYLRAFSITPDGKTLAWVNEPLFEPIVHLCDTVTGKELHALKGHEGAVLTTALRADGRRLVSLDNGHKVRAWHAETGAQLWQATVGDIRAPKTFPSRPLAFSPNGKIVACAMDTTLHLLDAATGKEIRKYNYGRNAVELAWSPDNSQIALVGGYGQPIVSLWDVQTGDITRSWRGPQSSIDGVAFSPDSRLIATGGDDDDRVVVWELASGGKPAVFEGRHSGLWKVAFSPDNRSLATGGSDSTIVLWDITRRMRDGKLPPAEISSTRFAQLWEKLADPDAAVGHAAVWELVAGGQTVLPLLKARMPVAVKLDARQAAKLVERLDADQYKTREDAMKDAAKLGLGAEQALIKALGGRPSLEPRRRVDAIVAGWLRSAEWLRFRRAVAVLEYNGSDEAKKILTVLAAGAEGARPTMEAAAALARLDGKGK